ncbi:MAG: ABC transporter ATP-binding protein/permease [Beijerinckiaceae bacterium]|nr:ABC transporter ATP-binding protein/permease [Beijerinckiaceae bacterium]
MSLTFARSDASAGGASAPVRTREQHAPRHGQARALSWPIARLGEGLEELARRAGLIAGSVEAASMPESVARKGGAELDRWLAWAAGRFGVQADVVACPTPDIGALLLSASPAIVRFADAEGPRFLLLLGASFGRLRLIAPDLSAQFASLEDVCELIAAPAQARAARDIEKVLDVAQPSSRRRKSIKAFMLADRMKSTSISGLIVLRRPAGASFMRQVRGAGVLPRVAGVLALFAILYVLEILGWTLIGEAALNGRIDPAWLVAWAMLILSVIPLEYVGGRLNASTAVRLGVLLKARLLSGSLRLDPDEIRKTGAGRMLASVMEAQAFEAIAINGGLAALVSGVELAFAFWLLSVSAAGLVAPLLLTGWIAIGGLLAYRFYAGLAKWTDCRSKMTNALVERMIGHRTVLAQDRNEKRDAREDGALKEYALASRDFDRAMTPFLVIVPMGWSIIGLAALAPSFISGSASPLSLAAGVGGVMFAARALTGVAGGVGAIARACVAWREIAPMFKAASQRPATTPFIARANEDAAGVRSATNIVEAHDVSFAYSARSRPVLNNANVSIARGERVLLQGGSGGGKSTFTALLTGLRRPDSGLLLLNGLDRQTLGEAWREFATQAPQFHDNHIFSGSLSFNLLMGRGWPASDADLAEALDVCEELGLGALIERMPAGLMQPVGETGWQLSHGERSRVFLGRAILQKAPLTILDESFAALDPQTLDRCIECAFRRTQTLVVVAHP